MFYDFALEVTAGTTKNNPTKHVLKLTSGIITHVYVEFPAGCRGYAYCAIDWQGHQLYPTNPEGAFNSEDHVIPIEDRFPLLVAPYELSARLWSPDATYNHTITVRVEILPPDVLYAGMQLPESLTAVIAFLGGGVPGVSPPTPPPEEPTPPPEEEEQPPPEEEQPTPPPEEEQPTPPPEEEEPGLPPQPGVILDCRWWDLENWRSMTDDIPEEGPAGGGLLLRFKILNKGELTGKFKMGVQAPPPFAYWSYSDVIEIEPGEGFIDWRVGTGPPGKYSQTFYLFSDGEQRDGKTYSVKVVPRWEMGPTKAPEVPWAHPEEEEEK